MSGIVLALGDASRHVPLIKKEMAEYFGSINVVKFSSFKAFDGEKVRRQCKRHGASVLAYVLPADGQICDEGTGYSTTRDHWKRLAENLYPSRSVKELELVAYAEHKDKKRPKYWLDGIDQYQASSREPVFMFDTAACY